MGPTKNKEKSIIFGSEVTWPDKPTNITKQKTITGKTWPIGQLL